MGIFGGGPSTGNGGNAAESARAAEEARQARITQGTADVNKTFEQFNPDFYSKRAADYSGYYAPQVDEQYANAHRDLVMNLARTGVLNGSEGARQLGLLDEQYGREKEGVASRASDFSNQARTSVEQNRSDVLNQLSGSADPAAAAASATARATTLSAPGSFSPIGQLFAGLANQVGQGIAGATAGLNTSYPAIRSNPISGPGSMKLTY
jgi:hypothetical protein